MLKRRTFYLLLLLGTFWLMLMYEGVFVEGMFVTTLLIPIALTVMKYITRAGIQCRWTAGGVETVKGKKIRITAIVNNMSFLPANRVAIKYEIRDINGRREEHTIVTNLMPFMERRCTIEICPSYSGMVTVTLKNVRIYDFLGLSSTTKKVGTLLRIAVYPKVQKSISVVTDNSVFAADEGNKYSEAFPGTDKTQIFDMAPYRDGDNIKDIHWKLSLKTDDFVVKKYSLPVSNEVNLFVDFGEPAGKQMQPYGTDKFFAGVFALIRAFEEREEKVSLYLFDKSGNGYFKTDKKGLLFNDYSNPCDTDIIRKTFSEVMTQGRNILISSRISEEEAGEQDDPTRHYTRLECRGLGDGDREEEETETIEIGQNTMLGVDITQKAKNEKPLITLGEELHINRDDEEKGIYTIVLNLLIVILGSYAPMAIFLDTMVFEESSKMLFICSVTATAAMFGFSFIKKGRLRGIATLAATGIAGFVCGIQNIVSGVRSFLSIFVSGAVMEIAPGPKGIAEFGLNTSEGYERTCLVAFMTFILAVLLFRFTWKKITISIHLLLTLPFVLLCFLAGCVPNGVHNIMYFCYLFVIMTNTVTYNNIIKNEKKILKKAFYESTVNIGAIQGYIMLVLVCILMFVDYTKGYGRSETLVDIKMSVYEYAGEFFQRLFEPRQQSVNAEGGIGRGELGATDGVEFSGDTVLNVHVNGLIAFPLYLRAYVGSEYTGSSWEEVSDEHNEMIASYMEGRLGNLYDIYNMTNKLLLAQASNQLTITEEKVKKATVTVRAATGNDETSYSEMYFIPYGASFTVSGRLLKDACIGEFPHGDMTYHVYQVINVDNIHPAEDNDRNLYVELEQRYREAAYAVYTDSGIDTDWGQALYRDIPKICETYAGTVDLGDGVEKNGYEVYINCVRDYLASNYEYSLSPGRLEAGEDFVAKFMRDKRGYCVHFATMATLMFRMYGIPARYVEGYYVRPEGEEIMRYNIEQEADLAVEDNKAHAWTEIYIDGYGWMPIEVTPGFVSHDYGYEDDTEEDGSNSTKDRSTTDSDRETTTENEESRTTGEGETTAENSSDENETGQSVRINGDKLALWGIILSVVAAFTFIFGRKCYKDKEKEHIMEGDDYSAAVRKWEEELLYAIRTVKAPVELNDHREQTVLMLAEYIRGESARKKRREQPDASYEEELLVMYRIFDRASYDKVMISGEDMEYAAHMAETTIKTLYSLQSPLRKPVIRYIKCLYLKSK